MSFKPHRVRFFYNLKKAHEKCTDMGIMGIMVKTQCNRIKLIDLVSRIIVNSFVNMYKYGALLKIMSKTGRGH